MLQVSMGGLRSTFDMLARRSRSRIAMGTAEAHCSLENMKSCGFGFEFIKRTSRGLPLQISGPQTTTKCVQIMNFQPQSTKHNISNVAFHHNNVFKSNKN
jgi:hypothetical protein